MSNKVVQTIVIILGILIILAFLAVIYGMYSKISISSKNFTKASSIFSTFLEKEEKIKDIQVINKNQLLVLIEKDQDLRGLIYDINNNKIISSIKK